LFSLPDRDDVNAEDAAIPVEDRAISSSPLESGDAGEVIGEQNVGANSQLGGSELEEGNDGRSIEQGRTERADLRRSTPRASKRRK
jgi:hypothetical protein